MTDAMIGQLFDEAVLESPLMQRQLELEQSMRDAGIKRFRDRIARAAENAEGSDTMTGTRLVSNAHGAMVAALAKWKVEAKSGGAGRRHTALTYIEKLDEDAAANIALRCCIDNVLAETTLTGVAIALAVALEAEVNSRLFEAQMPQAFKVFHEKAKKENLERRKWSHLLFPARLLGVGLDEWPRRVQVLVGVKMIELFIEATGLMQIKLVHNGGTTIYKLTPTADTMAWIEKEHGHLEGMFPVWMPTLIPPKPWTTPLDGGYYTIQNRTLTLVKTRNRGFLGNLRSETCRPSTLR